MEELILQRFRASLMRQDKAICVLNDALRGAVVERPAALKIVLYRGLVVGLYAIWEDYCRALVETWLAEIGKHVLHYHLLQSGIRNSHFVNCIRLASNLHARGRHTDAYQVVGDLALCTSGAPEWSLVKNAYINFQQNARAEYLGELFAALGAKGLLERAIQEAAKASGTPARYYKDGINELVQRRNAASHQMVDDLLSFDELSRRSNMLSILMTHMHIQYGVALAQLLRAQWVPLGETIEVYDRRIVCVSLRPGAEVRVGDWVVGARHDGTVGIASRVKQIQIDGSPVEIGTLGDVGLELARGAKANYNFYAIPLLRS